MIVSHRLADTSYCIVVEDGVIACYFTQVLRMEHLLLKVLGFDVAVPTANSFCDRFLKEANADEKTVSLSMVCIY